jgi:Fe-S cluster biogenesis protein NfuA
MSVTADSEATTKVASTLVEQFDRMVKRDGGELSLLGLEGDVVRVGYRLGFDPTCTDGVCVMPHLELEQLMKETLRRRHPELAVVVEVLQ